MVKVKVCGITNFEDASKAVYYGASALGFVFYKKSPRYISPSKARTIIQALPPFITTAGVFVNLKERAIRDICHFTRISTVQMHGNEDPSLCKRLKEFRLIKAFRVGMDFNFNRVKKFKVDAYMFDTFKEGQYGGTGETFPWEILKGKKLDRPVILSGGITAKNIKDAVSTVNPYAVDVSSGLEKKPGIKDPKLIREFFKTINEE